MNPRRGMLPTMIHPMEIMLLEIDISLSRHLLPTMISFTKTRLFILDRGHLIPTIIGLTKTIICIIDIRHLLPTMIGLTKTIAFMVDIDILDIHVLLW